MGKTKEMTGGKRGKPTALCSFRALWTTLFRRRPKRLPRRSSSPALNQPRRRVGADHAPVTGKPWPRHDVTQMPNQQKTAHRSSGPPQGRQVIRVFSGVLGELDSMIYDHQRAMESSVLLRASSGNVMLFGYLGNLRPFNPNRNPLDNLPQGAKETSSGGKTECCSVGGAAEPVVPGALSMISVPEELNGRGGMEYRKGRFSEALVLFEQATMICPGRALYWNNKAMVLTSLGRLLEAVAACREAVKIDPSFCRAHHRLATLYLRLGEANRAMHHYKQAGGEASVQDTARTRSLESHLTKCTVARKRRDWNRMLKEAQSALSVGANSAPKVFASQAEALLRLQRHEEAETILINAPTFEIDASTKIFGAADNGYILVARAQVEMAAGRFDDAISIAQKAAQIDPRNREIAAVAQSTRAVALASSKGNDLFKASKFAEACAAYGEGLDHDPQNSVLLCSIAACQFKLGQWEKAIEGCNLALTMRPSYRKARLRRADCYAKLGRWEDSTQDYQVLIQQIPGEEEVLRAVSKGNSHLKERHSGNNNTNLHANTVVVNTNQ